MNWIALKKATVRLVVLVGKKWTKIEKKKKPVKRMVYFLW